MRLMKKRKKTKEIFRKKRKQHELRRKRNIVRKQKETNRELKQYERFRNRKILVDEDINLCRLFELATTKKVQVNRLHLHETKEKLSSDIQVILN